MITREELLKTEEYWFETIQNEIYRQVEAYLRENNLTQSQFAEKLGVTKGYVSQILNGNYNATLKKLIELSLTIEIAPVFDFQNLNEYIKEDFQKRYEMQYNPLFNLTVMQNRVPLVSGSASNLIDVKPAGNYLIISEAA
ncbi:MAG: helix-turn-helix transcriptional regulator [Prolixibacteraceae bacterium]|jgi:transcriptional regulator with XRE-family HTH domain|nr:helix-turn-helix transcriptional regulator [Prolixibacteraceae bacterium]NLO02339.1 helix-turn-helix transcriptional regulator [Bacteroidales bacterium]